MFWKVFEIMMLNKLQQFAKKIKDSFTLIFYVKDDLEKLKNAVEKFNDMDLEKRKKIISYLFDLMPIGERQEKCADSLITEFAEAITKAEVKENFNNDDIIVDLVVKSNLMDIKYEHNIKRYKDLVIDVLVMAINTANDSSEIIIQCIDEEDESKKDVNVTTEADLDGFVKSAAESYYETALDKITESAKHELCAESFEDVNELIQSERQSTLTLSPNIERYNVTYNDMYKHAIKRLKMQLFTTKQDILDFFNLDNWELTPEERGLESLNAYRNKYLDEIQELASASDMSTPAKDELHIELCKMREVEYDKSYNLSHKRTEEDVRDTIRKMLKVAVSATFTRVELENFVKTL